MTSFTILKFVWPILKSNLFFKISSKITYVDNVSVICQDLWDYKVCHTSQMLCLLNKMRITEAGKLLSTHLLIYLFSHLWTLKIKQELRKYWEENEAQFG